MKKHWLAWTVFVLSVPMAGETKAIAVQFEPSQTTVQFTLGDVLHTVHGTFQLRRGAMEFDPESGRASGELVVDAASGNSGSTARDRRISKNILESNRYPDIIFRPDHVSGKLAANGTSHLDVHGMFTIHGASHEVALPVEVKTSGNGRFEVDTRLPVPYVQWGMKNPSNFLLHVDDTVEIVIHAVAKSAPES